MLAIPEHLTHAAAVNTLWIVTIIIIIIIITNVVGLGLPVLSFVTHSLYNRADLRCKKFGLCWSHLTFLFHCFNRFKTEFLVCYECFVSVLCMWHIVAREFSHLLPTELFLCHLFRSTMRMFYTRDILLPLSFLIFYRPNCFFAICFAQQWGCFTHVFFDLILLAKLT
jgi:hypothetical protein